MINGYASERYFPDIEPDKLRQIADECRKVGLSGGDPADWDSPKAATARRLTAEIGWVWDFTDWDHAASVLERDARLAYAP